MKRNKVITMVDSKYFQYGQRLLNTRHIANADFVCYGPDLNKEQLNTLDAHNIQYKKVNQEIWDTWMQSLKFQFMLDEIDSTEGGITFVDWDTYILRDWGHVFYRASWDIGVTVRNEYYNRNKPHRAIANGGVIFANKNAKWSHDLNTKWGYDLKDFFEMALSCIEYGGLPDFPEYDIIWKTLEHGRSPEKTHHRTDKRWWCDQILLSALAINSAGHVVKLFDCKQYNNIWEETPDTYIMHLKDKSGAPSNLKDGK